MHDTPDQELPAAMAAAGLALTDVSEVVLTHAHGDHIDGAVHISCRALISKPELRDVRFKSSGMMRRVLRQPLPAGFSPERSRSTAALRGFAQSHSAHPTVYLPSHDPESLARFTAEETVDVQWNAKPAGGVAELFASSE